MTNEIVLTGCAPVPLAGYLKALGVFRLIAEQADETVRGCWRNERFVLTTRLTKAELIKFFLESYQPTPIISPWNGRAGFLEGEDADDSTRKGALIVRQIMNSTGNRYARYRKILNSVQELPVIRKLNQIRSVVKNLERLKKTRAECDEVSLKQAKNEARLLKDELLIRMRSELSDEFINWLDACIALTDEKIAPAPLLGSGGNEGSMDFSVNHLVTISMLIDPDTDKARRHSLGHLIGALFDEPTVISLPDNPGFLSPAATGGVNMGSGFTGATGDNAWNGVFTKEGVLLFLSTITRRNDLTSNASLSFPFVFDALRAGNGSVGTN